jgi:hypothetical protein
MRNENILEEFKKHFNEPVLTHNGVARLIGYGEDDHDCYLLLRYSIGYPYNTDVNGYVWHTAVGGYYWLNRLKDQNLVISRENHEHWDDLYRLDNMLELNGAPKEKEFLVKIYSEKENKK